MNCGLNLSTSHFNGFSHHLFLELERLELLLVTSAGIEPNLIRWYFLTILWMMQRCPGVVYKTISFDLIIVPTFKSVSCKYFSLNMNISVIFFLLFPQGKGVEDTRPDSFVVC